MDIKYIRGIGEKRAEAFKKCGVNKIEDFLRFIPRTYVQKVNIAEAKNYLGNPVIVEGKVINVEKGFRPSHPVVITLQDEYGFMNIPVFGKSEFRMKQFRLNENYLFYGKISEAFSNMNVRMEYRDHLRINPNDENDKGFLKYSLIPVYELPGALKATWIKPLSLSKIVFNAFKKIVSENKSFAEDSLPENIVSDNGLMQMRDAILRINFPNKFEDIERARKRLSFEELFYLQILMALKKLNTKNEIKGISFITDIRKLTDNFVRTTGFELTNAQKKVINEIYSDMKSPHVMNRLLQGDVGSGKTIVSVFGMLIAAESGYQSALMCPTEILAEQHYSTVSRFIEKYNHIAGSDFKVSLLVGGQKKKYREEILNDISSGKTRVIIGTHALIQDTVEFSNLGLVIIDEQHKFGVMQRAKLKDKGLNPDVLVMTATPIPRTLSLTYYGDLDVSIIDEMPAGRIPVKTYFRKEEDKPKVWDFIKDKAKEGKQAFIIYPIIDESEKLDLKSAVENYNLLKNNVFTEFSTGMVHGRMFWYEIEDTMQKFQNGEIRILVATTVIEVGIDIPNATTMVIEDAQRFGLSQLHQLRGRVGRSSEQSYCILIAKNLDEISKKRIKTMCETNDGFKIAEVDLEIRGPGEFFGIRQSGVLNFAVTDLARDRDILDISRKTAFKIVDSDPQLRKPEHSRIRNKLMTDFKDSLYLMNIA